MSKRDTLSSVSSKIYTTQWHYQKSNRPKHDTLPKGAKSVIYAIKSANKGLGKAKPNIDIARSRRYNKKDILCYNHIRESTFFQIETMITKSTKTQKNVLLKQIEKELLPNDYNYERQSNFMRLHVSDKKDAWAENKAASL